MAPLPDTAWPLPRWQLAQPLLSGRLRRWNWKPRREPRRESIARPGPSYALERVVSLPVPDSPDGALIDDLVADIIDSANRHVGIASEAIERLTSYPALAARYGDFNLGLDFHGAGGRLYRRDIHKQLSDKGMSLRQIAAETGASHMTVQRDLVTNVTEPEPEEIGRAH